MKTKMIPFKIAYHVCFLFIFAGTFVAQNNIQAKHKNKLNGGFGNFTFSGQLINLNGLNQALQLNGYDPINKNFASFGGGGFVVMNNFLLGGNGAWLSNSNSHNSTNAMSLKGGYGFFDIGYLIYHNDRMLLFPSFGIGAGNFDMEIKNKKLEIDFSQQLANPEGTTQLKTGGLLFDSQINYTFFLHKENLQGFFIGVKAGYKFAPSSWKITYNTKPITNSPSLNMNGLYISLVFGGGSLNKK